jgi:CHAD domain-containing protein
MRIDDDVMGRSPEEGARLVALDLLAQAGAASHRLGDAEDAEALHDFRVAVRRLRSTLRAFRPWLRGSLRKRRERQLRKLARATGAARDAEVQLAWLAEQKAKLKPHHRPALAWLRQRLEARRDQGYEEVRRAVAHRFARLGPRMAEDLGTYQARVQPAEGTGTFASGLASLLRQQAAALREALLAVAGPDDVEDAHRARIEGKRLRYLLEPLRGSPRADSEAAVTGLKALQDVLGELHDAHVLEAAIGEALVEAAAERARRLHGLVLEDPGGARLRSELHRNPRPGLLAIDQLARKRAGTLFGQLRSGWLHGGVERLAEAVASLAEALEPGPGREPGGGEEAPGEPAKGALHQLSRPMHGTRLGRNG